MFLHVSVVGPEKERPSWKLLRLPSAPVFPHMLSSALPVLTPQSSTTLSFVETLMPLLFYPTFSCSPYMTLQGRSVHSTSFQVGSWLSYLNNGCSISTSQLRRETSSGAAQGTHARPRGGCQAAPAQQADEPAFWYLKAGKATSHASSPLFEQDLNLLEQVKPKKGNTIEIYFFKNTV